MSESCHLKIRLSPSAKTNAVTGFRSNTLYVKIKAPPVEGRANSELVSFLAGELGIKQGDITITHGLTSKNKLVSIFGMSTEAVYSRLNIKPGE